MKTPLEELIEELNNRKELFKKETNLHKQIRVTYTVAILVAQDLLQKEKEVIKSAFDDSQLKCVKLGNKVLGQNIFSFNENESEDYYNKTFKK